MKKVKVILIAILLTVLIGYAFWANYKQVKEYNGGQCNCGGAFSLFDIENRKNTQWYYYKCNDCENTIQSLFELD